jgi:hypothetical protein
MFRVCYRQIEDNPDPDYTVYDGWFEESIVIDDAFDFDNENINDLHYSVMLEDDHGCLSPDTILTFDQVQVPITVDWETGNMTECTEDLTVNTIIGGVEPYVVMVNDSVIMVGDVFTMPRGTHTVKVMDAHMCVWEQMVEVVGMYVTRDTTITTYIGGYETSFVDEEAGVDTMLVTGMHQWMYMFGDCERTLNVEVIEIPRPLTIAEVQGEGDASEWVGDIVEVTATVTAIAAGEGFFVQDANAVNSGIWVEYTDVNDLGVAIGDGVKVVGEVAEIADVTSIQPTEAPLMAEGTPAITPMEVTPSGLETEIYESVLVMVPGARATSALSNGQWDIYYEPNDNATVNDWLYSFSPEDSAFYHVTGIVNGRLDAFLLDPRMESDVTAVPTKVDPELANSFKVYPNPFNDKIYIDNNEMLTRVVITNIAGQRVIDVEYPEREIRTANLVSGVYLVNLFNEGGLVKTDRIVKR